MKANISVKNLIGKETGHSKVENIKITPREFEEIRLKTPIQGEVKLTVINDQIYSDFNLSATIILECSRCLKEIEKKIALEYKQIYDSNPQDDSTMLINNNLTIDIWPSIREELLVSIPMKALCKEKCKGIKIVKQLHS
ncbi:hypothetical protein A3F08_03325 [Candidatus Berkelbacteria bacterium RIFCSPHIGHO2_12_FULL_36_9]|uniref:DUF177 domain-containing protein n=1 Tax=Candidatus Berkelbacteria bacterium RIFCSPHIGHO2_12_FULL_36_9 TaxID=1797469 RepID=A0A1F5EKL4_9BACT|nr:MAG: hypothetical protein A3F08_03325 [Candidatus Berkelbacteria bacterium RIFCSPHIGHO2_12_FULL_36_9]